MIQLEEILNTLTEKTCVLDSQLRLVSMSRSFSELMLDRQHYLPKPQGYFFEGGSEQFIADWKPVFERVLANNTHEEIISREHAQINKHSKVIIKPITQNEQVNGLMVIIYDITHEKLIGDDFEAFKQLLSNLPNSDAFLCDQHFNFILATGGEMKKYNIAPSFYEGKNLRELAKRLHLVDIETAIEQVQKGFPTNLSAKIGNSYYLIELFPIKRNELINYFICLAHNITEIQQINLKLQQTNQTKDAILSIVAHDLRNPVSAIIGFADVLKNYCDNEDGLRFIELINRSCMNTLSIINDLLDIAELGNEDYKLKLTPYDLNEAINQTLMMFEFTAREKDIRMQCSTNQTVINVALNIEKFNRVLANLLSNAIKFSHEKQDILIHTQVHEDKVTLSIQDFGIGIPVELQDIIFDRFTKAGRRGTAGEKSFGLGMSIVKQIVRLHHGKIWLESTEHKGTTVHITLNVQNGNA